MKTWMNLALMGISVFLGCQKQTEFDRTAMLTEIAEAHVLPTLAQLETAMEGLETAATDFVQQPNMTHLETTQNAWRRAMEYWSEVEMLYFGPGRENYLYIQLDNTPTDPFYIERVIQDTTLIDSAAIQTRSSYTKGLGAIEYLLFEGNTGAANLLPQYQTAPDRLRRQAYLLSTIQYTKGLVQTLHHGWRPEGDNYAQTLSQATDDGTTGGLSRYSNAIIHISQTMARKKIGKPLGKESPTIDPSLVESPYAAHTYAIIAHNLAGIAAIFGQLEEQRLGAFLTHQTGSPTATERILDQLEITQQLLEQRTASLQQDLQTDPTAVEALYQAHKTLHELIRSELSMAFSITVLTNPDDGD